MTPIINAYWVLACDRLKKSGSFLWRDHYMAWFWLRVGIRWEKVEILVGMKDKAPIFI